MKKLLFSGVSYWSLTFPYKLESKIIMGSRGDPIPT